MARRAVTLLLWLLLAACAGQAPSGTSSPISSLQPGASGPPASSGPAPSTNPTPGASTSPTEIPQPTITDPEEIGFAMLDPERAADAVVSLISVAGISIYATDGTLLRAGTGATTDVFLFDDEVRGLISMAVADATSLGNGDSPSTFGDVAQPLAKLLGGDATASSVLDTYGAAYALDQDRLMAKVAGGLIFLPDEPVSRAEAWFLLVDGVVGLGSGSTASARVAAAGPAAELLAASGGPLFQLPPVVGGLTALDLGLLISQLPVIAYAIPFDVAPGSLSGHQGHGGPGDLLTLTARVRPSGQMLVSPTTGLPILQPRGGAGLSGLPVEFRPENAGTLRNHGMFSPDGAPVTTDATGAATFTYQLDPELDNGQGDLHSDASIVDVAVSLQSLVTQFYDVPVGLVGLLGSAERIVPVPVVVEWHEVDDGYIGGPGSWTVDLAGPGPGAGSYHGTETVLLCTYARTTPYAEFAAVLNPTASPILHISLGQGPDGKVSASVSAGDGELMLWNVGDYRQDASINFRMNPQPPVSGQPVTLLLASSWTTGTAPYIQQWSMDITVACERLAGL